MATGEDVISVEIGSLGLCETCAESPQGIDGHAHLHPHSQPVLDEGGKARFVFRCVSCGASWSRVYAGSGRFDWVLEWPADGRAASQR
jgi:hypothetical protein